MDMVRIKYGNLMNLHFNSQIKVKKVIILNFGLIVKEGKNKY